MPFGSFHTLSRGKRHGILWPINFTLIRRTTIRYSSSCWRYSVLSSRDRIDVPIYAISDPYSCRKDVLAWISLRIPYDVWEGMNLGSDPAAPIVTNVELKTYEDIDGAHTDAEARNKCHGDGTVAGRLISELFGG